MFEWISWLKRLTFGRMTALDKSHLSHIPAASSLAMRAHFSLSIRWRLAFESDSAARLMPVSASINDDRAAIEERIVVEAVARLVWTALDTPLSAHRSELVPGQLEAFVFGCGRDRGPKSTNMIDIAVR